MVEHLPQSLRLWVHIAQVFSLLNFFAVPLTEIDTVLLLTILEMHAELLRLGARQQDKIGKK